MSFYVTVTFDLKGAESRDYPRVKKDLEGIDFSKFVRNRLNPKLTKPLPNNTFVAKFEDEEFNKARKVSEYVGKQIERIFRARRVKGRYFIVVGQKWAWKMGTAG